jgi:hypothetical protein
MPRIKNGLKMSHTRVKLIIPAFFVLVFNMIFSYFYGDLIFKASINMIYLVLLRFIRFTLLLCIPLYALLPVYSFIIKKIEDRLVQGETKQEKTSNLLYWLYRPFQGIGISLLFGGKLIAVLPVIAGSILEPSALVPRGGFNPGLFIITSVVTIAVSIFLSVIWSFDEVGIRYVDRKRQEMRILGKYAETITPLLFGMFGIFSLFERFAKFQALLYLFKIIIILYPPFLIFSVVHAIFIQKRIGLFSKQGILRRGRVWIEEK